MPDVNSTDAGAGDESPQGKTTDTVAFWNRQIDRYDRAFAAWQERCKKIIRIYTEERRAEQTSTSAPRKLSLLWSNISTLQPAVYARLPHPSVSRRFKDADPIARAASELVERALSFSFDRGSVDDVLRQIRDDYLLVSRGAAWVRYEADFEAIMGPDGEPMMDKETDPKAPAPMERIADERVAIDYVHWRDFGHTVARNWQEVTAVWRHTYLTRKEVADRFSKEIAEKITFDQKAENSGDDQPILDGEKKAKVTEIWDRSSKKVYFISKCYDLPLEIADPYLTLDGFFPCPKPVYGTLQDGALVPVPDYVFYQDQIEEIDDLTQRIGTLTDALKVVGFYPQGTDTAGSSAIEKALDPSVQNRLIPVPSWAAFAEKGGANQIQWLPVTDVVAVIQACFQTRKQLIDDVYQVTGISDIVRGESDPRETLGAQQIKNQWGAVRIRDRQAMMAMFVRDIARIAGQIIADKFQPETLMSMANMQLPTRAMLEQQQALMQAQILAAAQAAQAQQGGIVQQPAPIGVFGPPMGQPVPTGAQLGG